MAECLTPQSAARIASMKASDEVQSRIDELADKCTEGELTIDERAEYESAVLSLELVMLLQVEAQATLAARESR